MRVLERMPTPWESYPYTKSVPAEIIKPIFNPLGALHVLPAPIPKGRQAILSLPNASALFPSSVAIPIEQA